MSDFLQRSLIAGLTLAVTLVALHALGHNSWVVSDRTRLEKPGTVRLAFVTGHDSFPSGDSATQPDRIRWWDVVHKTGRTAVTGYAIEGNDLIADFELTEPGLHIAAAMLHPRFIEFDAEKFSSYLRDEKAFDTLKAFRADGTSKPGLEYYTKMGKAFIQVGPIDTADRSYAEPVGQPLEIVPLTNPVGWRVGETVRVRVLSGGEPSANAFIASGHESSPAHDYEQEMFTDEQGVAEFVIDKPGHWFIRTHEIGPCDGLPRAGLPAGASGGSSDREPRRADWESYWASMTVEVPG